MPSPFPGMNPYLEQPDVWHDFHERFMPIAASCINAEVGPNYYVKIDEHIYVHEADDESRELIGMADIAVTHRGNQVWSKVHAPGGLGLLEPPVKVHVKDVCDLAESFVEIRDRRSKALVTVLELLSPSNKSGRDRPQYVRKRQILLASSVNLVEIDLLRGGARMPFLDLPPCDY